MFSSAQRPPSAAHDAQERAPLQITEEGDNSSEKGRESLVLENSKLKGMSFSQKNFTRTEENMRDTKVKRRDKYLGHRLRESKTNAKELKTSHRGFLMDEVRNLEDEELSWCFIVERPS